MFCIAFDLSVDYEVFLLSHIEEEHDRTGDNAAAVAMRLERTDASSPPSAVLMSVVFLAFATSDITVIKLFGVGLALAVLIDAFVIRATLVPAFMRLAGEINWRSPKPLRGLYDHVGIREPDDEVMLALDTVEVETPEALGAPSADAGTTRDRRVGPGAIAPVRGEAERVMREARLKPIGQVKSSLREPVEAPKQGDKGAPDAQFVPPV